ncbi:MAG: GNAT family N-acetyltransferase [Lachnospiraceae bacterium]|nr:GNAT family N-acetyltransferase [Lachnospiraceae bacterium]
MLRLRPYKPCDADKITSWIRDEKTFFLWGGERFGSFPITAEDMNAKYLSANGDCEEPDNFYPMTACDGDAVVGHFIMRYLQGNPKVLRFGWVIVDAEKRGKGYGREMLRLGLDYAFRVLKAETVTIGVFENNSAAYHCYTSVGFRHSSILPDVVKQISSEQWNLVELEMTEKEYFSGRKKPVRYSE